MAFAVTIAARLLLFPPKGGVLTTRNGLRLRFGPLSRSPSRGLLTLRFDPGRFPPKPAACYRAS